MFAIFYKDGKQWRYHGYAERAAGVRPMLDILNAQETCIKEYPDDVDPLTIPPTSEKVPDYTWCAGGHNTFAPVKSIPNHWKHKKGEQLCFRHFVTLYPKDGWYDLS